MSPTDRKLFSVSRTVLRFGLFLTFAVMALVLVVLLVLFIAPEEANLAGVLTRMDRATAERVSRDVLLIGFLVIGPLVLMILRTLLTIVETAITGDPFILENGRRLRQTAWLLLALNVAGTLTFIWINALTVKAPNVSPVELGIPAFSFSGWLTVLMVFVIARIFEHGSEMRAELQGTV